jgi:SNF2 family DNA or RNA helicase
MIDQVIDWPRCGLLASLGSGKTSATLSALNYLALFEDFRILVIAPKRVAHNVWPEDVEKFEDFKHFTVSVIKGTPKQRKEAIRVKAKIHTINYELLPWLLETVGKKWPWDVVVADEASKLKSFRLRGGSIRARALAKVAWTKIRRFIALTATPASRSLIDLWGWMWFLDKGERLGRTLTSYKNRWFRLPHPNAFDVVPMPHASEEIADRMKDICVSVDIADYVDLKEPIETTVYAYLPGKAMKMYQKFEREMYIELKETGFEAKSAATKSMKCLQLANGAAYTEDNTKYEVIHDAKFEALDSVIEDCGGENLLVAYYFKSDIDRLLKYYPGSRVLKDDQTLKDWNAGKIPLLFVHGASVGHGINAQYGGSRIAILGHDWNLENRIQLLGRLGPTRQWQAGINRTCYIYNIVAKNTVDELVLESHKTKKTMQDLLLERSKKVL